MGAYSAYTHTYMHAYYAYMPLWRVLAGGRNRTTLLTLSEPHLCAGCHVVASLLRADVCASLTPELALGRQPEEVRSGVGKSLTVRS